MDPLKTVAAGGQPTWEETFEHPEHGQLTFKLVRMPRARDWLNQAVLQEQIAPGIPSTGASAMLAASLSGLQTILQVPAISEERVEDPDNPTHVKVTREMYDPMEDENVDFVMLVWASFWKWRTDLLERRDELKNSSGETTGDESDEASPSVTDSPSTTPA